MKGTLYGVGVGPGDPELITVKAARIIRQCQVLAVPDIDNGEVKVDVRGEALALGVARAAVPEAADKPVLRLYMPMTRDKALLGRCRDEAAAALARRLEAGEDVAFLTLGDPSFYSTYLYLHGRMLALGHAPQVVAGVPSFCAAAARLGRPLAWEQEPFHVVPASYPDVPGALDWPGAKVIMKAGGRLEALRGQLARRGLAEGAALVERCGLAGERVYPSLAQAGERGEYFSLILTGEGRP